MALTALHSKILKATQRPGLSLEGLAHQAAAQVAAQVAADLLQRPYPRYRYGWWVF